MLLELPSSFVTQEQRNFSLAPFDQAGELTAPALSPLHEGLRCTLPVFAANLHANGRALKITQSGIEGKADARVESPLMTNQIGSKS